MIDLLGTRLCTRGWKLEPRESDYDNDNDYDNDIVSVLSYSRLLSFNCITLFITIFNGTVQHTNMTMSDNVIVTQAV